MCSLNHEKLHEKLVLLIGGGGGKVGVCYAIKSKQLITTTQRSTLKYQFPIGNYLP